MGRKKEDFFNGNELSIDHVVEAIQNDVTQTRAIMEFIASVMKKDEEFKQKLHELEDEYEEKKEALYNEYGVDLDY